MEANQHGLTWHDQGWSWRGNRDKSITCRQACAEGIWKGQWARAKGVRGVPPLMWHCRVHTPLVKTRQRAFWPPALPSISFSFHLYTNYIQYKWSQRYKWGKLDLSWNLGICFSKQDTHFTLCPGKGPRSTYRHIHLQLSSRIPPSTASHLL